MQATMMEMTVMSYMAVTPVPMTENTWVQAKAPVATPTMRLSTVPIIRMRNTFTPTTAPTSTTR